jgi:hypothetical protein
MIAIEAIPGLILQMAVFYVMLRAAKAVIKTVKQYPRAAKVVYILDTPNRVMLNTARRFTPDAFYKLWLETGIMPPEDYREFQDRGWISDDLDPDYIQKRQTHG